MLNKLIIILLFSAFLTVCSAQKMELIRQDGFRSSRRNMGLRNWQMFETGQIKRINKAANGGQIPLIRTTQTFKTASGKESWEATFRYRPPVEIFQGLHYRLKAKVRGKGRLFLGIMEYPWKHFPKVLATPGKIYDLSGKWQTLEFDYTPQNSQVSFVRPFLRLHGWLRRCEIRNVSFEQLAGKGNVDISASDFVVKPGGTIPIKIKSSSFPLKLMVFGPGGVSGPGGETGGAAGFVDVFRYSKTISATDLKNGVINLRISSNAEEGSWRVAAVSLKDGGFGQTRFSVYPEKTIKLMRKLLASIKLPKGSRLFFLGDSLTANFPGRNHASLLQRALKWQFGNDLVVINAAVAGDTVVRIAKRLDKDVISKKPTHVFFFEGANDCKRPYLPGKGKPAGWYTPEAKYIETYKDIVKRLKKAGAKVVIVTCSPGNREILDDFADTKRALDLTGSLFCLPAEIKKIVAIQKRIARENSLDVIDANAMLSKYMRQRAKTNSKHYLHIDDGVHLSEYGNREMAIIYLKYLADIGKTK